MAVPPGMLGLVERKVGMLQQFVAIGAIFGRDGNAHRGGDGQVMAADFEIAGKNAGDVARDHFRLDAADAGADQHELVAAETRDMAAPVERTGQPFGHLAQKLVADDMAQRVVDFLEPVEVHPQDGGLIRIGNAIVEQVAQPHLHRHAVFHAGQAVIAGQPLELDREVALLLLALHRFQHDAVRGLGDFRHGEDHQEAQDTENDIADAARDQQADGGRQHGEAGLADRDMDPAGIAPGNAARIGSYHADGQDMQGRILADRQRRERLKPEQRGIDPSTHFIGDSPDRTRRTILMR